MVRHGEAAYLAARVMQVLSHPIPTSHHSAFPALSSKIRSRASTQMACSISCLVLANRREGPICSGADKYDGLT